MHPNKSKRKEKRKAVKIDKELLSIVPRFDDFVKDHKKIKLQVYETKKQPAFLNIIKSPAFIIAIIFILLLSGVYFLSPGITGLFIAEKGLIAYEQNVSWELNADSMEEFIISSHPEEFNLKTFRLSGSYIGNGTIKAYLETKGGTRYLILDNEAIKEQTLARITGWFIAKAEAEEMPEDAEPDYEIEEEVEEEEGIIEELPEEMEEIIEGGMEEEEKKVKKGKDKEKKEKKEKKPKEEVEEIEEEVEEIPAEEEIEEEEITEEVSEEEIEEEVPVENITEESIEEMEEEINITEEIPAENITEDISKGEEVDENVTEEFEEEINITEIEETNITEEIVEDITEEIQSNVSEEDINVTEEVNVTEANITQEINITETNITKEINVTEEVNITEINITEELEVNVTEEVNITMPEINITPLDKYKNVKITDVNFRHEWKGSWGIINEILLTIDNQENQSINIKYVLLDIHGYENTEIIEIPTARTIEPGEEKEITIQTHFSYKGKQKRAVRIRIKDEDVKIIASANAILNPKLAEIVREIEFESIGIETSMLPEGLNDTEYKIVFEVDDGLLKINKIDYVLKNLTRKINITPTNITNITYEKIKDDPRYDAIIDLAEFSNETNELKIVFHHDAEEELPIRIEGAVKDYVLSKKEAVPFENITLTIPNYNNEYFRIFVGEHTEIYQFGVQRDIDFNATIKDSKGDEVNATVEFIDTALEQVKHVKEKHQKKIKVKEGRYKIKVKPENKKIKEILFEDINIEQNISEFIQLEDVPEFGDYVQVYAINPTEFNFTNATVTVTAKGNALYKCKDWNFTEQRCYGSWTKIMNLIPGQEYSFTLTPEDPGFGEVIEITKAVHLDENRTFISNIYDEVKALDNNWSEPIYANEYVRVTFEKNLTANKDITLYARNNQSLNTTIEVYYYNSTDKITEFPIINETKYYKVLLTGMNGSHDTFDLKIVNTDPETAYLEFDYIVDPATTIHSDLFDASGEGSSSPNVVFTSDQVGYVFFVDTVKDNIVYKKTTDGGANWGSSVYISDTDKNWANIAVWYDQWTPGDATGTKIHIVAAEPTEDDVWYSWLDTSNDTLRATEPILVYIGGSYTPGVDGTPSITKSTDGYLFVLGFSDASTGEVYKSVDGGDNWSDTGISTAQDIDWGQLLCLSGGDILLILYESSTSTAQSKVYDEATDTWDASWATIDTWVKDSNYIPPWGASLYKSTSDVYLAANTKPDGGTGYPLKAYKFIESTRIWSNLTNIGAWAEAIQATMAVDQNNGNLYAVYIRGAKAGATTDIYWKNSTDGGSTWSAESTALDLTADDYRFVRTNFMSDERIYAVWYNDDLDYLLGNTVVNLTSAVDTTPPSSVTNLANQSQGTTWIYWNWTNPGDADFSQAIVYIDGSNIANTSNSYYNATGLTADTSYTITVHTKDTTGNVNDTDVNSTASTLSAAPPQINITSITITPDDDNVTAGTQINPLEASNVTITLIANITNASAIDTCKVRIHNASDSYASPTLSIITGTIQLTGTQTQCNATWNKEYWRNSGDWNVSVDVNLTDSTSDNENSSYYYNVLTAHELNSSTVTFSGTPGQTVNSSDAYPLTVRNTGNKLINISLLGANFIGVTNSSYSIGMGNVTYNESDTSGFIVLTSSYQQIYQLNVQETKEIYFRGYMPIGTLAQNYQANISIKSD